MNRRGSNWSRGGLRDSSAEQLSQASIAPVIHVQAVRRYKNIEGKMLHVMPIAHHRETLEQVDIFLLRGERNLLDHAFGFRLGNHGRRKLRIDQDYVAAGSFELLDAVVSEQERAAAAALR
jgi:hypothetical protein